MLDLTLSDEQQLLKNSAQRFVERDYPFSKRRQYAVSARGFDDKVWQQFAQLGWLAIGMPEDCGGFGGARETAVLVECLGRGLVVEPYLACVVMAAKAVALAAGVEQRQRILGPVMGGQSLLSLAHSEPRSRYCISHVLTQAERTGEDWVINGRKSLVLNGDSADRLIVSARTSCLPEDEAGITLFVVDGQARGVTRRGYASNDGGHAADVVFDKVTVPDDARLGEEGAAYHVLEQVHDRAAAALCAESLGLMAVLNELTLDYAKTREQFGQAIGKFQALQHRMVDMFVALEESRSVTTVYMADVESGDRDERRKGVSAMKVQCDKASRIIGQEAVQLHGGIAMTDDYAAAHYFKRLSVIARLFGDIDWHLDRFADLTQ